MSPLEFATRAEWLEWRRTGCGASDAPIILGLSKYKKPFALFCEKAGRVEPQEINNPAIDKGNELEPIAREKFAARWNFKTDSNETFAAKNVVSRVYPWMRASLDGCSDDGTLIVEIKYQGKDAHKDAHAGIVNKAYYAQIQHQLYVSGAISAVLVSIDVEHDIAVVPIERNEQYIADLVRQLKEFWECVQANRWPSESPWAMATTPPSSDNVQVAPTPLTMLPGKDVQDWFTAYQQISAEIKDLEAQKKEIQEKIFSTGVEVCGPFRVITVERKGNVDYSKIEVLKSINLDAYRGKPTVYKQIKVTNE